VEWLPRACAEVVEAIRVAGAGRTRPLVVALDGASGSGKSMLAACVASRSDAAVIPVDDFFAADIPEEAWARFSVEERLRYVFDWQRVREDAIVPLLEGKPARWYAFDFAGGVRADGTYGMQAEPVEVPPAGVILLDGAYSAGPALDDLVDVTVLVDVPAAVRHARLAAREEATFLAEWHRRWDPVEAYYFTHVRPRALFDVVVDGAG
jgi:uridine kinase